MAAFKSWKKPVPNRVNQGGRCKTFFNEWSERSEDRTFLFYLKMTENDTRYTFMGNLKILWRKKILFRLGLIPGENTVFKDPIIFQSGYLYDVASQVR